MRARKYSLAVAGSLCGVILISTGCQMTSKLPGLGWMNRVATNPFRRVESDAELPPPSVVATPKTLSSESGSENAISYPESASSDDRSGYPTTDYPNALASRQTNTYADGQYATAVDSYEPTETAPDDGPSSSVGQPQKGFYGSNYDNQSAASSPNDSVDYGNYSAGDPGYVSDRRTPTRETYGSPAPDYSEMEAAYDKPHEPAYDDSTTQPAAGYPANTNSYPSSDYPASDYPASDYPTTDRPAAADNTNFDNLPLTGTDEAPQHSDTPSYGGGYPDTDYGSRAGGVEANPGPPQTAIPADAQPSVVSPPTTPPATQPRSQAPWRPGSTRDYIGPANGQPLGSGRARSFPLALPDDAITMSTGYSRPPILR